MAKDTVERQLAVNEIDDRRIVVGKKRCAKRELSVGDRKEEHWLRHSDWEWGDEQ